MQSIFQIYLHLGFEHISDINAYDHILFLVALCAVYQVKEWRKVLLLVTAFTIGHSITLALAVLDIIAFSTKIIEFLIPVTILLTSLNNILRSTKNDLVTFNANTYGNYVFTLLFGTIHGMGFSNFLRSSIMPGMEEELAWQLLSFNIGVELGQLLIVGIIFCGTFLVLNVFKVNHRIWTWIISILTAILSILLMIDTYPW